jgi:hypothetical protein
MQGLGVLSIFLCVVCILFLFFNYLVVAKLLFAFSLCIFLSSLALSLAEINISTNALELELSDMEE